MIITCYRTQKATRPVSIRPKSSMIPSVVSKKTENYPRTPPTVEIKILNPTVGGVTGQNRPHPPTYPLCYTESRPNMYNLPIPTSELAVRAELPQRADEPDRAYDTLIRWVQLGGNADDRELSALIPGLTHHMCARYREEYSWAERWRGSSYVICRDRYRHVVLESIRESCKGATASEIGVALLRRLIERWALAEAMPGGEAMPAPRDIITIVKELHAIERLNAGQSTHNVAVASNIPTLNPARLAQMSTAQLDALETAMPELFADSSDHTPPRIDADSPEVPADVSGNGGLESGS